MENARLFTVECPSDLFVTTSNLLKDFQEDICVKNIIFCEEKISLMIEREICAKLGGSFNTEVLSFNRYKKKNTLETEVLSKEGSVMAIKKVLSGCDLKCLAPSKTSIAPNMYELISQLKSAKVSSKDLLTASSLVDNSLKEKLIDIATIFDSYEKFLQEKNLIDQSQTLDNLPEFIESNGEFKDVNVFLVGFSSWTMQGREIVKSIIKNAKSTTAILVSNPKNNVVLGETAKIFADLCAVLGVKLSKEHIISSKAGDSKIIADNLFNYYNFSGKKIDSKQTYFFESKSDKEQANKIGEIIKRKVLSGNYRYSDFTIALPSLKECKDELIAEFEKLEIPHCFDDKKNPQNNPLIRLIISYIEVFRRNFEKECVCEFFKNPLIIKDKNLSDRLENYIYKYNVNYTNFLHPFVMGSEEEILELENARKIFAEFFADFNIDNLLTKINAEENLISLSEEIKDKDVVAYEINKQIYNAVVKLLLDMKNILKGEKLSLLEIKNIFISGVMAMEISILPSFIDAVFIGEYKTTSLANARVLFCPYLTSNVPMIKEDVALLSDDDIGRLEGLKVLIEPKIKIVNKREKEVCLHAISAFSEKLYLSYSNFSKSGSKNNASEVINQISSIISPKSVEDKSGYYSLKSGLIKFAQSCSNYVDGIIDNFEEPSSFYKVAKDRFDFSYIFESAKREVKLRLNSSKNIMVENESSPTKIEEYYTCPYKAFLSRGIRLKPKEEGDFKIQSVGTLIHQVLKEYVKEVYIKKTYKVTDKQTSDNLVNELILTLKDKKEYMGVFNDTITSQKMDNVIKEAKSFCYKTFLQIESSKFKPFALETSISDEDNLSIFSPIYLDDKKVKLVGNVDRVDCYNNNEKKYYRIIDYKTGKADDSFDKLYMGTKLQLYLYSSAIKDGEIAGVYYYPISETQYKLDENKGFCAVGKTLGEKEILIAQDENIALKSKSDYLPIELDKDGNAKNAYSKENLESFRKYAIKVSENAVKEMADGVIVSSPIEDACEYCDYFGICQKNLEPREVIKAKDTNILDAIGFEGGNTNEW